jgi:hypothetical protein
MRKFVTVKFGVLVPQGWKFDLEDIEGPEEQFEAMVRVGAGVYFGASRKARL